MTKLQGVKVLPHNLLVIFKDLLILTAKNISISLSINYLISVTEYILINSCNVNFEALVSQLNH